VGRQPLRAIQAETSKSHFQCGLSRLFGRESIGYQRAKPDGWDGARPSGERRNTISEVEVAMTQVQVEQKTYQMPPKDGITVAHFLSVADIERSLRFYETVFGSPILSRGDSKGAPGYIRIANTWLIVNVGGGPTPDKPSVTLSVPANPDSVNSFMNIRVADIQACYELSRSRGAEFITGQVRRDALLHSRS